MEERTLTLIWGDPTSTVTQYLVTTEEVLGDRMGTGEASMGVTLVSGGVYQRE